METGNSLRAIVFAEIPGQKCAQMGESGTESQVLLREGVERSQVHSTGVRTAPFGTIVDGKQ